MGKKIFVVDVAHCNGCHSCQIACKDENCEYAWAPYAAAQPETGQFWCKVDEIVHGSGNKVNISYIPKIGAQDDAVAAYAPEVVQPREDGIIVIDPEKSKGRKDIAEKFAGVYYNEELDICQGCTGCAHLLDDPEGPLSVPRCVDACVIGALRFGDEEDFAGELEDAVQLTPGSHVYYLNYPKRWVAGQVYDAKANENIVGAKVVLEGEGVTLETATDEFGDFWFRQVEPGAYTVSVAAEGHEPVALSADAAKADVNLGAIALG